jgi:hypothetical protein
MRSDNTDGESGLPVRNVPLFPAYPKAGAMPIGLHAGPFVNGLKLNELGPLISYPAVELESPIVHFL